MPETLDTLKQKLLEECDAMLLYMAGRGVQKDPLNAAVFDVLDTGAGRRGQARLADILAAHRLLAQAVSPAFPETIALLRAHEKRSEPKDFFGWWWSLTPLPAVHYLLLLTFGLAILLLLLLAAKGTSFDLLNLSTAIEYLGSDCFKEPPEPLRDQCEKQRLEFAFGLYTYFGLLGMLGAAYASIYDSFAFIREGRYDMRLASTYYVRVFIGGFSGVLLAAPLSRYLAEGAVSSGLLAFIGGFAAQVVYNLLNKIADSIENMFRIDRRREQLAIMEASDVEARKMLMEEEARRNSGVAHAMKTAMQIDDPAKRSVALTEALMNIVGSPGDRPQPSRSDGAPDPWTQTLALLDVALELLPYLPDADQGGLGDTLRSVRERLVAAAGAVSDDPNGPARQTLAAALTAAKTADPLQPAVLAALGRIAAAAGGPARAKVLAEATLRAGFAFRGAEALRWNWQVYGAAPATLLALLGDLPGDAVSLPGDDPVGRALAAEATTADGRALLLGVIRSGDPDRLFSLLSRHFGDRAGFDAALDTWCRTLAQRCLEADVRARILPDLSDRIETRALIEQLGTVAQDEEAKADLQRMALCGAAAVRTAAPDASLAALIDVLREWTAREDAK